LSHPEEFSFSLYEGVAAAADQKLRTSTVVRDQDAIKEKIHPDNEVAWLEHVKSLWEQGIGNTQMLVLRL